MNKIVHLVSPNFSDIFEPNIDIGKFPDGDSHIRIPQIKECVESEVFLFHRLYPKQNTTLVTLLLILNELKQVGAKKINVVIPYLPYSRQDKQKLEGEIPAARSLCRILKQAGLDRLITFDCHFLNEVGVNEFEGLSIENLSMGPVLVEKAKEIFNGEEFKIIGPDDGSRYLVEEYGGMSLKKVRKEYEGAKVGYRDVHEVSGELNVSGKNVLILDDIISSGSTMVKCLDKVTSSGAKKVVCATTHGLFLFDCVDRMKIFADQIISSDSIVTLQSKVSIKESLMQFYKVN